MTVQVNYTAEIELTSKSLVETNRIKGRFFNSLVGHEQGEEAFTAPIQAFKVINNQVFVETQSNVFRIRNLSTVALSNFNTINAPVYIKKNDPQFDEMVHAALFTAA